MRFRVVLLWAFILATIFSHKSLLVGQTTSENPQVTKTPTATPPLFKTAVRRVVVDVVVRNSDGRPVRGLTPKDFSVFEDGKPQNVVSFDVYDFDKPSISLPAAAPALPSNTFVNIPSTPERGPLFVILYDMVNMEVEDQITARQQILKFIDGKPAGTRLAIWVNSDELHLLQGFTDNKELLYAALDPHHPRPHVPMSFLFSANYGKGDTLSTMRVLTHIAAFLDGLPGRKNLIWMAGLFPVTLYPTPGDPQDLRDDIKHELNELSRAQVAVYPVNIRGVVANPEGPLTGTSPYGGSHSVEPVLAGTPPAGTPAATGTTPGGVPDRSTANLRTANALELAGAASNSLSSQYMVQNDVATATGGRAFYSDNDLRAILDEATENGANYYSLTYAPTNANYDGNVRNIRVTLPRHNWQLQYRRSYYADDPYAPTGTQRKADADDDQTPEQLSVNAQERPLYAGLQYGAPMVHQLMFKVRVHAVGGPTPASDEQWAKLAVQPAYFRGKNKKTTLPKAVQVQEYAIYYGVASAQVKRAKEGTLPLEFAAVGFDAEGGILNGVFEVASNEQTSEPWPQEPDTAVPPGRTKYPVVYHAMQELFLPVSATSIRAAVRDLSNDRVGAVEVPLPLAPEAESTHAVPSEAARPN